MSDKEFITGIISGDFNENDVYFRCKNAPNIKAFYASLIEAECRLREKYSGMPVVSFNVDAELTDDYKLDAELTNNCFPDMTIENKRQLGRIDDAIAIVESLLGKGNKQRELPKELQSDEAQKFFKQAINQGLMDNNYNWLDGREMLACFVREMSKALHLGKGERISWKPFEILFGIDNGKLRLNYNDILKTGDSPKNIHLIDAIFKD